MILWLLLMTGDHQSNHMTGGPAQAKLCCYDGWLRPQICTEEKVTYSVNKLPCMDIGLLKNLEQVERFYLSFHSHPFLFWVFTRQTQNSMELRAWKAATPKLTWQWPHFCNFIFVHPRDHVHKMIVPIFFEIFSFSKHVSYCIMLV
jgi:hypothetical protein